MTNPGLHLRHHLQNTRSLGNGNEDSINRPRRKRMGQGPRPDQRHHAGHGLHDRLRHLHRLGGDRAAGRFAGIAHCRLGRDRIHDHHRRAGLRRVGCHDAARRRTVRVPPRIAGPAVGISLRLDAIPRHPDRHHCGGGSGLRQIPGRVFPFSIVDATGFGTLRTCRPSPSARWC